VTLEQKIGAVHESEIRGLRALRLSLTALHDHWQDIITICGLEPDINDPAQSARTQAWNVFGPLLHRAAHGIERLTQNPALAECDLRDVIAECEQLITLKREDWRNSDPKFVELRTITEERRREFAAEGRTWPENDESGDKPTDAIEEA